MHFLATLLALSAIPVAVVHAVPRPQTDSTSPSTGTSGSSSNQGSWDDFSGSGTGSEGTFNLDSFLDSTGLSQDGLSSDQVLAANAANSPSSPVSGSGSTSGSFPSDLAAQGNTTSAQPAPDSGFVDLNAAGTNGTASA
ncbi:hypothetical protein JCM10207_000572 [Rhodosporidiobolus poonsookiae]